MRGTHSHFGATEQRVTTKAKTVVDYWLGGLSGLGGHQIIKRKESCQIINVGGNNLLRLSKTIVTKRNNDNNTQRCERKGKTLGTPCLHGHKSSLS